MCPTNPVIFSTLAVRLQLSNSYLTLPYLFIDNCISFFYFGLMLLAKFSALSPVHTKDLNVIGPRVGYSRYSVEVSMTLFS